MTDRSWLARVAALLILVAVASSAAHASEKYDVTIIDRQDNRSSYTYVVPGYSTSTSTGSANCFGAGNTATCSGAASTTEVSTPAMVGSYQVRGATLSLRLPDGRVAVVNCASKTNWTDWSTPNMYRGCRVPPVNSVRAEFYRDGAKLTWPVSIDGKTKTSETYKILAVLERP